MLGSKRFEKTIVRLVIAVLLFAIITVIFPGIFSRIANEEAANEYPIKLFDQNVINIEITADDADWNKMLEDKMSKPYIACDLKIDGREFDDVGLRPKGNSSLTSIQGDRISFRLDFDHYIDNQTCYGLEQMVLNNLQADATYMKDYIAYDLMAYEGVNAPLHTFANITLNGEPFGVYLAAEVYDEDYLERVYKNTDIKLYSVKSSGLDEFESALVDDESGEVIKSNGMKEAMGMGGPGGPPPGNGGPPGPPPGNGQMQAPPPQGGKPQEVNSVQNEMRPQGEPREQQSTKETDANMLNGAPPPPGGSGGGGDLVYVDNSTESYSNIFANSVSKDADAKDYARVIRAIKYLNKEGVTEEELEKYWDVDSALRYLAVHTFMVNGDSYTGNMQQNYYLAEQNGKITVLPWDYNLSFGAFGGGPGGAPGEPPTIPGGNLNPLEANISGDNQTTEVINQAIDTPTIGVDMESRPLVSVLLGKEEYKQRYHNYLDVLTKYASDEFVDKLEIVESAIYPYVEKEKVVFYTADEHKAAFETLKKFLKLRSQSIQGQLKGTIPSETDKQTGENLITADFSINEMGSMGGGPDGGPPGAPPGDMGNQNPPGPPHGDNGQQGYMPPHQLGMPRANQVNGGTSGYAVSIISLIALCGVFVAIKLYKRNY